MPIPISHLTQGQAPLVTISPAATLQDAVALMIEHNFTQLPVVEDGKAHSSHFVTSGSIVRALRNFGACLGDLHVRDAIVGARVISADEDLFSKMDDLLDAYGVLVLNPDRTLAGIVTNYDTTQYFRRRAEDMLLVEDIETTLKDHVRAAYGGDENDPAGPLQKAINALSGPVDNIRDECRKSLRKFCRAKSITLKDIDVIEVVDKSFVTSKKERKFDDLTLTEYIQLARKKEAWDLLGPIFEVSDKAFLQMLEGMCKTRNKLMHFRPDIEPVERDQLRFCAEWFKNHPARPVEEAVAEIDMHSPDEKAANGAALDTPSAEEIEYIEESLTPEGDITADNASVESKYAPLANYLLKRPQSQQRLTLTFAEIERMIDAPLPAAAREHRSWWANDEIAHVQSGQWLRANWRAVSINMTEQKVTFARAHDRERAYIQFFGDVQNKLRKNANFPLFDANPLGINWLVLAALPGSGQKLILSFALRQRLRLEFYIDTGDGAENKRLFDCLEQQKTLIESNLGCSLAWERLENRRASRLALYTAGSINDEPQKKQDLIAWAVENAVRFHNALQAFRQNCQPCASPEQPE